MDFLDPKKKHAHQVRLFIGYGLMGVVLIIATLLVVFATYGYDIDREKGTIIQNGLISVDTHPEAADIYINGKQNGRTADRLVLPAGDYSIELRQNGYRSWSHDVTLEGSSIEQLVYPFLFPESLQTKSLRTLAKRPSLVAGSPDRHWLVTNSPGKLSSFDVIDLNDNDNPLTTVALPDGVLTAAAGSHSFRLVEWSTDNTNLVIKHTYAKTSEYILLNRAQPARSTNLTKAFNKRSFDRIRLRDKNANLYYLLNSKSGELFTADLRNQTTTSLAKNVLTFQPYQADTVLYVTRPAAKAKEVTVRLLNDDHDIALRLLPAGDDYLLDLARFQDHFYVCVGGSEDGRAYIYKDPETNPKATTTTSPMPFRVLITDSPRFVSFSTNARFIALQGKSQFSVYDAETDRQFHYNTKQKVASDQQATWMDGHRLSLVSSGKVHIFDFDGQNAQTLAAADPTYSVYFDRDYKALFSLAADNDKDAPLALTRTELRLNP